MIKFAFVSGASGFAYILMATYWKGAASVWVTLGGMNILALWICTGLVFIAGMSMLGSAKD